MLGDIQSKNLIIFKGLLFVVLGAAAAGILLLKHWSWENALWLGVAIWAFCRAYYFAFYVIGKYVDPEFKFAGIGSAVMFLLKRRRASENQSDEEQKKRADDQQTRSR